MDRQMNNQNLKSAEENQSIPVQNEGEMTPQEMIKTCMQTAVPMVIAWGELASSYIGGDSYLAGLGMLTVIASAAIGQSKYTFEDAQKAAMKINKLLKEGKENA